jgi:hypothetical protein
MKLTEELAKSLAAYLEANTGKSQDDLPEDLFLSSAASSLW